MVNSIPLSIDEFRALSSFIYTRYGIHLPEGKRTLLECRLQKRLRELNIPSFEKYLKQVISQEEHEEVIQMINLVSTNKTDFFRERTHFDLVSQKILPEFLATKPKESLKVWSAACSSGEEVYTLGITLEEYQRRTSSTLAYSIVGTDISTQVLDKAREAIYPEDRIQQIPFELKQRYFLRSKNRLQPEARVIKTLRDKSRFVRFNLIGNNYPAADSFHIIFCRNVLIYFDRQTQEKIVKKLFHCLKPGGYLFLGHSESIIGMNIPLKQIIHTAYRKI